jgi:hypothetical protein
MDVEMKLAVLVRPYRASTEVKLETKPIPTGNAWSRCRVGLAKPKRVMKGVKVELRPKVETITSRTAGKTRVGP